MNLEEIYRRKLANMLDVIFEQDGLGELYKMERLVSRPDTRNGLPERKGKHKVITLDIIEQKIKEKENESKSN